MNKRQITIKDKTLFISCIIPVFNEEVVVESFLISLINALKALTNNFEIIVIDDGSHDGTIKKLQEFNHKHAIKILGLSRNFGKEVALTAGLEHCRGEIAIMMDADFQHPIETLPVFIEKWGEGYDMVYGIRKDRETESYSKRNLARLFYWIMSKIAKIEIPRNAGDFRLLDQRVITALKSFPERTRFMKGLYAWVGYKRVGVVYNVQVREAGKTSWRFSKLTELAITGITSFSDVPLRVWGMIGSGISLISFIYAIFIITTTLLYGTDLPGFPTLIVAIMFLGGIQLMSVGILGEYIARIFTEVKQRPKYLVQVKEGFDEQH